MNEALRRLLDEVSAARERHATVRAASNEELNRIEKAIAIQKALQELLGSDETEAIERAGLAETVGIPSKDIHAFARADRSRPLLPWEWSRLAQALGIGGYGSGKLAP